MSEVGVSIYHLGLCEYWRIQIVRDVGYLLPVPQVQFQKLCGETIQRFFPEIA